MPDHNHNRPGRFDAEDCSSVPANTTTLANIGGCTDSGVGQSFMWVRAYTKPGTDHANPPV